MGGCGLWGLDGWLCRRKVQGGCVGARCSVCAGAMCRCKVQGVCVDAGCLCVGARCRCKMQAVYKDARCVFRCKMYECV